MRKIFKTCLQYLLILFIALTSVLQVRGESDFAFKSELLPNYSHTQNRALSHFTSNRAHPSSVLNRNILSELDEEEVTQFLDKFTLATQFLPFNRAVFVSLSQSSSLDFSVHPFLPQRKADWIATYHSSLSPPSPISPC